MAPKKRRAVRARRVFQYHQRFYEARLPGQTAGNYLRLNFGGALEDIKNAGVT